MSKLVNTRLCIEEAILELKPDISDQELLNLREKIITKFGNLHRFMTVNLVVTLWIIIYILERDMYKGGNKNED